MISRYEAVLNGQPLSAISADILIRDINYGPPQFRNTTYTLARRNGARIHRRYVERTSVTISFEIHTQRITERQAICNAVQQWARNGGILETNDRAGQRLRCVCDVLPVIGSVLRWTEVLAMTFTAYEVPFWEQIVPETLTQTGSSGSGTLFVPGSVDDALVEVEVTAGGTLTTLSLTANGRTMTLSGISVESGNTVKITYDEHQIQSIRTGNTSLLNKRTGVDDLLVDCGQTNTLGFSADVSCTVEFKVRGLWL